MCPGCDLHLSWVGKGAADPGGRPYERETCRFYSAHPHMKRMFVTYTSATEKLMALTDTERTAIGHALTNDAHGESWVCVCDACRQVRADGCDDALMDVHKAFARLDAAQKRYDDVRDLRHKTGL